MQAIVGMAHSNRSDFQAFDWFAINKVRIYDFIHISLIDIGIPDAIRVDHTHWPFLTPVQAAEIAQNAGVKKLVFYHVVPPLTNFILKRRYLKGVGDVYDGDVEVGEDGMTFTFAPKR